jgi:hypothetical protein
MDRISLTWLIYGIIGFMLGMLTINNVICTTSSTIILSLYGIIGIVLVLTVKNKQENLVNYASIDKKGMANIHTTGEQLDDPVQSVNNRQQELQPSQLSKCDSDNALYFNPLPHEYKNGLLGTSNDPLPSKYDPFNSDLIGTYTTNQISYKFNMA